jgi:homoserine O-succinyltransferase
MPLVLERGESLVSWSSDKQQWTSCSFDGGDERSDWLKVALVNNMPDAAIEDTEEQFCKLLAAAADGISVQLKLCSLPNIPRGQRAQDHLATFYKSTTELLNQRVDGVIITGTEPRQKNLRDEPYWEVLVDLFDWAAQNTTSAVLSCLAAHAAVLHSHGIARNPLKDKCFGVFEHRRVTDHALTIGSDGAWHIPHSRWNELRSGELTACGYRILSEATGAGVDLFVKQNKKSLFVHFQGHPEYLVDTLFKEYRRDVKRFLRGERDTYPLLPEGYFSDTSQALFAAFREKALLERREDLIKMFPAPAVMDSLEKSWGASSVRIYRNWLEYLACHSEIGTGLRPMTSASHG